MKYIVFVTLITLIECLNFHGSNRTNIFGMGLVTPGDENQISITKDLIGEGGWILLIFAGVNMDTKGPEISWIQSLNQLYDRHLKPVVRIGPSWGNMHIRDFSDDDSHLSYKKYAQVYKKVVEGLPVRNKLYIQVHNEPGLCYEWWCQKSGSPIGFETMADEYAHFLSDVIDAIKSIGNKNIKVSLGAIAPGSALECGCCGQESCGDKDKPGITGLQYMDAMKKGIPNIWNKIDFLTSHSYPAQGIGWGFNVPFDEAIIGLDYWKMELETIGRNDLEVLITETGWATHREGLPSCSEEQKAEWYINAFSRWNSDDRITGVMPFMLMDGYWGDKCGYGFVKTNGERLPCFSKVKELRCKLYPQSGGC